MTGEPFYSGGGPAEVVSRAAAMAEAFGIAHIMVSDALTGSTIGAAAARGAPAILAEAGGMGQLDEESVALHLRGLRNVLRLLGVLPGSPDPVPPPVRLTRFAWLRAEHAGCWYPAVRGRPRGSGAADRGLKDYWGEVLAEHRAPADGVVLFVATSLAINSTDPLAGIGAM